MGQLVPLITEPARRTQFSEHHAKTAQRLRKPIQGDADPANAAQGKRSTSEGDASLAGAAQRQCNTNQGDAMGTLASER